MRTARVAIIFLCALACFAPRTHASTIFKRDGGVIDGTCTPISPDTLRITTPAYQSIDVRLADIAQIAVAPLTTTQPTSRPSQRAPVEILDEGSVLLNQSSDDAINGITGYTNAGAPIATLTNATSRAKPSDDIALSGDITWDLGADIATEDRQLDSFSIWIVAGDPRRSDYAGQLSISRDGKTFDEIAGTPVVVTFAAPAQASFNHVVYKFAPGRVTDFRYLRFTAFTVQNKLSTRFVEMDAFVSKPVDPLAISGIITRAGSRIVGQMTGADARVVKFIGPDGQPREIACDQLQRLMWYRLPASVFEKLPPGSGGAVLRSGDFCEGELKSIEPEQLTLSSVAIGIKAFNPRRELAAFVFAPPADARPLPPAQWSVQATDGSLFLCVDLRFTRDGMTFIEPCVGRVTLPWEKVASLRRK